MEKMKSGDSGTSIVYFIEETALKLAIAGNHLECVQLLASESKKELSDSKLLAFALQRGASTEIIEVLFRNGACIGDESIEIAINSNRKSKLSTKQYITLFYRCAIKAFVVWRKSNSLSELQRRRFEIVMSY